MKHVNKGGDQGEPDEHEHPENEEVIEEALEPGLHKRVAVVHKASQEGEDDEEDEKKKAKDNEDAVRVNDPHGYRLKADDVAHAQDQHPLLGKFLSGLGEYLAEQLAGLGADSADQIGSVMPKVTAKSEVGKSTTAVARSVRMKPLGDKEAL
jgi:hypothetical protein